MRMRPNVGGRLPHMCYCRVLTASSESCGVGRCWKQDTGQMDRGFDPGYQFLCFYVQATAYPDLSYRRRVGSSDLPSYKALLSLPTRPANTFLVKRDLS